MKPIIDAERLRRIYGRGENAVVALDEATFHVNQGEMVAIMGPSGSGKSTLMNILGLLDRPTAGRYALSDVDVSTLSDEEMTEIRSKRIGFVFQQYNLLSYLTALENVEMPLLYQGISRKERQKRASEILRFLGLGHRFAHRPGQLSGGEQQRVALARALVTRPSVVLADEPTGNLSTVHSDEIMGLLQDLNRDGISIMVVTHDESIARHCQRIIRLKDGAIVGEEPVRLPVNGLSALEGSKAIVRPTSLAIGKAGG